MPAVQNTFAFGLERDEERAQEAMRRARLNAPLQAIVDRVLGVHRGNSQAEA